MRARLSELRLTRDGHVTSRDRALDDLVTGQSEIDRLEREAPRAARRYQYYQDIRGYVTDLIECFNEKVCNIRLYLPVFGGMGLMVAGGGGCYFGEFLSCGPRCLEKRVFIVFDISYMRCQQINLANLLLLTKNCEFAEFAHERTTEYGIAFLSRHSKYGLYFFCSFHKASVINQSHFYVTSIKCLVLSWSGTKRSRKMSVFELVWGETRPYTVRHEASHIHRRLFARRFYI